MLHNGNNIPIAYSPTPNFCYNSSYSYNTIYYVSAICGIENGGHPELFNECYSIAAGTPVMWQQNPIAVAGNDKDTCGLVLSLNANTPELGMYGYWSSDCEFFAVGETSHTDPNAIVMATEFNTCTFTWNVVYGGCVATDNVILSFMNTPNPFAGNDMTVCGNTAIMEGVASLAGTDLIWTGNGTSFNPQSSANAQALVGNFGTYQYTLTESNSACSGEDQVLVTYIQPPSPIVSSSSDTVCGTSYNLHVITTADADGQWRAYDSGMNLLYPQPIFIPSIYDDTVTVTIGNYSGSYRTVIFEWEEYNQVNSIECFSSVAMEVLFAREPVASVGASDESEICGLCVQFAADTTGSGWAQGIWIPRGLIGEFENDDYHKPDAVFCISEEGNFGDTAHVRAPMLWAMRNYGCISIDTMWVTFYQRPEANAGGDTLFCGLTGYLHAITSVGDGVWTTPSELNIQFADENNPYTQVTSNVINTDNPTNPFFELIWTEDNSNGCTDSDTIKLIFARIPSSNMHIIPPKCFGELATIAAAEDSLQQYTWNYYGGEEVDSLALYNNMGGDYQNFVFWTDEEETHIVSLISTNFWGCQSPVIIDTIHEPLIPEFATKIISDTCALGKGGIIFEDTLSSNVFFWIDTTVGPISGTPITTVYNIPAGEYDIQVSYLTPNVINYAYYIQTFGTCNCLDTLSYEIEPTMLVEASASISMDVQLHNLYAPASVIFVNSTEENDFNYNCIWVFGDGTSETNCNAMLEHIYYDPGCYNPYMVTEVSDLTACRDTAYIEPCINIQGDGSAGLYHIESDYLIYPNPCRDIFYIETVLDEKIQLEIIDAIGNEVMYIDYYKGDLVSTSSLKSGLYTLKITDSKRFVNKKLIVIKD
ncbi:MAG: T9SS type A sorting domain-containing protein [Bacteroidales bacterium]|nr:T9SS type A sorting domain-containing protein [Bacteroidales bacterium]